MLTLKKCKEILGDESNDLTDDEINLIKDWLLNMADILIESNEKNENLKK